MAVVGTVYLLHYTDLVRDNNRHYLGFTERAMQLRLQEHKSGILGSKLSNLAVKIGAEILVSRTWEGVSVDFEKKLKRERHLERHCPLCMETRPVAPKAR